MIVACAIANQRLSRRRSSLDVDGRREELPARITSGVEQQRAIGSEGRREGSISYPKGKRRRASWLGWRALGVTRPITLDDSWLQWFVWRCVRRSSHHRRVAR